MSQTVESQPVTLHILESTRCSGRNRDGFDDCAAHDRVVVQSGLRHANSSAFDDRQATNPIVLKVMAHRTGEN